MKTLPSFAENGFGFRLPMELVGLLVCATFAVPVVAQTPPDPSAAASESGEGLPEIVVTAQRREESLQQTPISVSALTSQQLTDFGVTEFVDYARSVPNMSFGMGGSPFGGPAYGYSSTRQIVIRGIAGADTTSLYIDDTPIPNVVDPRVFDLERIEILRGPQGTLFGASSMGGTVRLITKKADRGATRGNVHLQAFDINAGGGGYDISGSLNVPLVAHSAALRLSVFDSFDPAYFTRVFGVANVPGVDFAPGTRVLGSTKVGERHQYGGSASFPITPEAISGLSIVPLVMLQTFNVNGYPLVPRTTRTTLRRSALSMFLSALSRTGSFTRSPQSTRPASVISSRRRATFTAIPGMWKTGRCGLHRIRATITHPSVSCGYGSADL
jgi:iron complex outermembrane recepter protein